MKNSQNLVNSILEQKYPVGNNSVAEEPKATHSYVKRKHSTA